MLGTFEKLRNSTINFVFSVRPSVRPSVLVEQLTDFYEIRYMSIFRKLVEKLHVSLKSDKKNERFTLRPT